MRTDRGRIASWLSGSAAAAGGAIAMLVCCTTTTAAAAGGGMAAAGGVLRSPWLIVAGLVVVALTIAAVMMQRTGRYDEGDPCGGGPVGRGAVPGPGHGAGTPTRRPAGQAREITEIIPAAPADH